MVVILGTGQVVAQTTATRDSNSQSAADGAGATSGELAQQPGSSAADEATTGTALAPLSGVYPVQVGSEWQQRLEASGIPPESLWAMKASEPDEEETKQLMARRHYFMGWYHRELGQDGRAIEEFTSALEYEPDNSHILLDAARARLGLREVTEAHALINQVLDTESTNIEAMRLKAEAHLTSADAAQGDEKEQNLKDAVESLEKARQLQPQNLEVLRSLAKAYVQQQEVNKVISVYRDIVKVDPRDTYSLLILAQILSRMDRADEAIEYYQKVIEQRRGFIGGYIYLGQLYERLKRYGDAMELYKQALLVDARNADILRRFEELLRQIHGANETEKILGDYQKFVQEYPANTEVRRIFAERLLGEEMPERAIEQYEALLNIDPENVETLIALGKVHTDLKDYDKAAEYLGRAVDINPDKIDLYDAIASTMLAKKDSAGAAQVYQKAIDANPMAEKLYISLAALLEDDGRTTDAVNTMEAAVDKIGDKPALLAVLGKFYRSLGDGKKAELTLRRAYELEKGNLPLFGELMSLYLVDNNLEAAEDITSQTAKAPGNSEDVVYSVAAEFYFNAGRMDKAIELYLLALRENPTKLDYLARVVGIANRQKLFDKSLELVEEFGGRIRDKDKIEQLKAEIYLASEQYDKAVSIYRGLISENPLDLAFYQYLVDAYNEAGRYEASLEVVRDAEKKFGNSDPEAIIMMEGMVHYKHKEYANAEKAFKRLIEETKQQNEDAYYYLGSVYLDQERFDQAEEQFRKAIEINPNSANALNALGYMFADRAVNLEEAKELITQALDLNPTAPHILDSMGWVLYREGDLDGALDYIERAARHYEDPEIFAHLGEIYAKQGKLELARQMFERVLELDPDFKDVQDKLKKISSNGTD